MLATSSASLYEVSARSSFAMPLPHCVLAICPNVPRRAALPHVHFQPLHSWFSHSSSLSLSGRSLLMRPRLRARRLGCACVSFVIFSPSVSRALATGFASSGLLSAALFLIIVVLSLAADDGLVEGVSADVAEVLTRLLRAVGCASGSSSVSSIAGTTGIDLFQDGLTAARSWKRLDATGELAMFDIEAARPSDLRFGPVYPRSWLS